MRQSSVKEFNWAKLNLPRQVDIHFNFLSSSSKFDFSQKSVSWDDDGGASVRLGGAGEVLPVKMSNIFTILTSNVGTICPRRFKPESVVSHRGFWFLISAGPTEETLEISVHYGPIVLSLFDMFESVFYEWLSSRFASLASLGRWYSKQNHISLI